MMKKTPLALMAGTLLAATAPVTAQDGQSGSAFLTGTITPACGLYVELGGGATSLDVSTLVSGETVGFTLDVFCNHIGGASLTVGSDNSGVKGTGAVSGVTIPYNIDVDGKVSGDSGSGASGELEHDDTYPDSGTLLYGASMPVSLEPQSDTPYAGTYTDTLRFSIEAGT